MSDTPKKVYDRSKYPARTKPKPPAGPKAMDTKPVSLDDVRQRMLSLAGVGEPKQIELIRLAVRKYEEMLSAQKKQSVGLHEVIDVADNLSQLRAADSIIELTGMKPTKDTHAVVKVNVMVNLPAWAQPALPGPSVSIKEMYTDAQIVDKTGENPAC